MPPRQETETAEDIRQEAVPPNWLTAVRAAEEKQATAIRVLDLREVTSFADYFVLCSGGNPRQIQAIAEEIILALKAQGELAQNTEGFEGADWILIDYGDLLVHVFSEKAREYYDLERLWRHSKLVDWREMNQG